MILPDISSSFHNGKGFYWPKIKALLFRRHKKVGWLHLYKWMMGQYNGRSTFFRHQPLLIENIYKWNFMLYLKIFVILLFQSCCFSTTWYIEDFPFIKIQDKQIMISGENPSIVSQIIHFCRWKHPCWLWTTIFFPKKFHIRFTPTRKEVLIRTHRF